LGVGWLWGNHTRKLPHNRKFGPNLQTIPQYPNRTPDPGLISFYFRWTRSTVDGPWLCYLLTDPRPRLSFIFYFIFLIFFATFNLIRKVRAIGAIPSLSRIFVPVTWLGSSTVLHLPESPPRRLANTRTHTLPEFSYLQPISPVTPPAAPPYRNTSYYN
jgi:hypothetical protein